VNHIIVSLFALLLCFRPAAFGNPFAWADSVGGKGMSHGNCIVADKNSNLFVCGQMNGTFQPGKVKINGKNNFLIKYNPQGSILWARALPGLVCKCVSTDVNGNPCVAGYFSDTVQIGKFTLASAGLKDFFVMKLDSLGNILWANSGGGNGDDMALAITCDVAGNTNITGSFESYVNFNSYTSLLSLGQGDMFVAQYDTLGNFFWAASGGGNSADAGTAIGADLYGDIFVTGYFNGSATFHNNHVKSGGGNNMFIVKYSPLGYQLYARTVSCNTNIVPNGLGLDGSGNVYICGMFSGTAVFGEKTITTIKDEGFVAAYDNSLNINWLNQIIGSGNNAAFGIAAGWTSNIFVTGVFSGNVSFNGSGLRSTEGSDDIFIVKYDAAGRVLWTQRAGGPGADSSFSICVDKNDIPTITGLINSDADFGEFTLNADNAGSFFIAQMKPNPADIEIPNNDAALFQIYPNPSKGIFNIKESGILNEQASMTLTDLAGKVIAIENQIPAINNQINLYSYPNGIYFLTIETRDGMQTKKLMKTSD